MQIRLELQDAKITGSGIGYAGSDGEDMSISVHIVASIGVKTARQFGEDVAEMLYRDGEGGPRLNLFKKLDLGLHMPNATLTMVRYQGADDEAIEGRVRSFLFEECGGPGVLLHTKVTFPADGVTTQFLLNQKKRPMTSLVIEGDLKGAEVQAELKLEGAPEPVGAEA